MFSRTFYTRRVSIDLIAELWRNLCLRTYPAIMERYEDGADAEPDWRTQFFVSLGRDAKV